MRTIRSTVSARHRAVGLLAAACTLFVACGDDSSSDSPGSAAASTTTAGDDSPATTGPASPTAAANSTPVDDGASCVKEFDPDEDYFPVKVEAHYSEHWAAEYHGSYAVLTVPNSEGGASGELHYVLVRCGAPAPVLDGDLADAQVFQVPIHRTVLNHRNGLAMLEEIGALETIVGLADSILGMAEEEEWIAERVDRAASTTNVGDGDTVEYEVTLGLEPDVVLLHGYGPGYSNVGDTVARGLPAVMISNLIEPEPLGSAEWIEFLSVFYGTEARATARFAEIEASYDAVTDTVAAAVDGSRTAAYLCFDPDRGCEFMYAHGEQTMNGRILAALGVDNVFAEGNDGGNGTNFDYEDSLGRASDASFMVVYEPHTSIERLMTADDRYANFAALAGGDYIGFTDGKFRQCRTTTYVNVDRVVQDFAAGLWPELFPEWEPDCFSPPA